MMVNVSTLGVGDRSTWIWICKEHFGQCVDLVGWVTGRCVGNILVNVSTLIGALQVGRLTY